MRDVLIDKIAAVRMKRALVVAGEGAAAAALAAVGMLVVAMLLDAGTDLAWGWRAILLGVNAAVTVGVAVRWGVGPMRRGADDEALALAVERREPAFASRLIASVQLGRPGALGAGESTAVVRAMIEQTVQLAEAVDFRRVISTERLVRQGMILGVVLLLSMGAYVWGGDWSPVLVQRAFLGRVDLPTKTRVEVLSGSFVVARGESAVLRASARGVVPEAGRVEVIYASGRQQETGMERSVQEPSVYATTLMAVQETFRYRVRLNDGVSAWFEVRCEELPVVASLACTQIYPKYAERADVVRRPTELRLLNGSRLRMEVTASKAARGEGAGVAGGGRGGERGAISRVVLGARDGTAAIAPVALRVAGEDGRRLTAELTLPANVTGFSIQLVDAGGLASQNAAFYPIELLADQPPTVRLTAPERKEVLLTADATIRIGFLVEDDYGVGQAAIKYRIDGGEERVIPLEISGGGEAGGGVQRVRGYYPWAIGRTDLPAGKATLEGSTIEYFVEAQDKNDLTGPGVGTSEHYQLRIVSKAEKQAELIGKLHESFSSVRELSESQEKASADLGTLIRERGR